MVWRLQKREFVQDSSAKPSQSSNSNGPPLTLSDATTIADHLKLLRQSLNVHVPYAGGVHPVKPNELVVYYANDDEGNARVIDLANATEAQLGELAAACEPAPFGVNQENVLDESYRKAGKMDLTKFSARLDVVTSGLLNAIGPDILDGQNATSEKVLRAEMYKLNVYGPGSFFKAHKDTPRGEDMIGSLVIVFPTAHKGGELTLSHGGTTWSFDSAAELTAHSSASDPALAYVAFYSDVTHAVEPVLEGHRVTLTYNLFLVDRPTRMAAAGHRIAPAPEQTFEDALRALLADPAFLPAGGLLAFGLAHQYPLPIPPKATWVRPETWRMVDTRPSSLGPVLQTLKGSDARIRTISERAGLATHVKMLYNTGEKDVIMDNVLDTENVNEECGVPLEDEIEKRGVVLARGEERVAHLEEQEMPRGWWEPSEAVEVHWVTRLTELNRVGGTYIAYGNDASIEHVYGSAALFVSVPATGEGVRATGISA